ncbi:MAG: acyl carrier protein [Polyangiaceae bacterium]|nr:acyl carrier protein [Polyangiaceae bacterium]
MSNATDLELKIAEILIRETRLEDATAETFDPDVDLIEEVGLDSMDLTTVVLVLQDEFKIQIPEDEYPKLTTVRKIAAYVQAQLRT